MKFIVIPNSGRLPKKEKNIVVLFVDGWDDWFKYSTMYNVFYYDGDGERHRIGEVKIGQFDMERGQRSAEIPDEFESLDDRFFSIGQDDSYYEELNNQGTDFRTAYLEAMRDMARDAELFDRAKEEDVTGTSLLRSVSDKSVTGQYRRMAQGGARLTNYAFSFTPPPWGENNTPPTFEFKVEPESYPPTNVHVLIGRNNVGKTYTVDQMTKAVIRPEAREYGEFIWEDVDDFGLEDSDSFTNIVTVTFSAFDPFEPLPNRWNKLKSVRYQYVGLKYPKDNDDDPAKPPKSTDDLAKDFGNSVQNILAQSAMRDRWFRALKLLESDPIFKQAEIGSLHETLKGLQDEFEGKEAFRRLRSEARKRYSLLSSGHKIVVLTITRLVETIEERSLVLMDEPEAHLHPPLLSAFVRSLSDLLINRNGMAIIATHSPVILQEVPKTCVWRMWREGQVKKIKRPETETFGENVGSLTQQIFGLEVTHSGFHTMLRKAVNDDLDFDGVVERFDGQLGDEARSIVHALIAERNARE